MRFREIRTRKRAVRAWLRELLTEARKTGRAVIPGYGPAQITWDNQQPSYSPTNRQAKRQRCKASRRARLRAVAP